MADETTKDIWNDNDGEKETPKRSGHSLRHILTLILVLLLVLGVVLVAAYRDGTGFDVIRRYFSYGRVESAGGEEVYDYDASAKNQFAVMGSHLVVLSDTSLGVMGQDGSEVWSSPVRINSPALDCGGGKVVAYDVGGTSLYVLDQKGGFETMETTEEAPYLSARLNHAGWLAVTSGDKNYKGSVVVYNAEMGEVFRFHSSKRFVIDAWVSNDSKILAAVTLGQEDSVFVSNVVLYDLTKAGEAEPVAEYDIKDGLVMSVGEISGKLATVSDTCLTFADMSGEIRANFPYKNEFLREYSLEGDDFAALLLNRYQSGSVGRLVTVASDGTELGTLDVHEEIQSISANGRYLAVLYIDKLVVYNQQLQEYASLQGIDNAKEVLVRPDGSALLLSSEEAHLFLP